MPQKASMDFTSSLRRSSSPLSRHNNSRPTSASSTSSGISRLNMQAAASSHMGSLYTPHNLSRSTTTFKSTVHGGRIEADDTLSYSTETASLNSTLSSPVSNHSSSQGSRYAASVDSQRGGNFKVVIRVRPPLARELHGDRPFQNVIKVDGNGQVLTVSENPNMQSSSGSSDQYGDKNTTNSIDGHSGGPYGNHIFSFDHVYSQECTQRTVYENTAKAVVESSLEGYNATIFAYGQTGTGKTYTMEGFNSGSGSVEERGIIPRAIEQIFDHIRSHISSRKRFLVRASYLQIYNESISDLLKPERTNLTIREDKKRGVFVEGLSEWVVRSPEEIYGLMERGGAMRATGSTKMNELSSRSHAVFIIIAEQSTTSYVDWQGNEISQDEFTQIVNRSGGSTTTLHGGAGKLPGKLDSLIRQSFKVGKLNLVDLAGSERVRLSGATGQRLEESKKINQSLSALGNVIAALTDARGRQHIPYRDSKLTRILEDSLGGNCKTTMMAMISPALEAMTESLSTLKFANRAKHIKNEASVNEDLDQKSLLRKYERELKRLRRELEEKNRNVVDKRRLLELDAQRRQAEEDKMAAIRALEERSREFMKEKEEKKKLEQRILMLTSQMLMSHQRRKGGSGDQQSPSNKNMNKEQRGKAKTCVENAAMSETRIVTAETNHIAPMRDVLEDPVLREAIKEHQERIRKEYECRLADLEKERETIEEEKAQVDRYKQLLLKQRDIMIALTQRLNERDEQITALQDELDAYDRHQKELEEKLDEKTAHLIHLQRVAMEQQEKSPEKQKCKELSEALGIWGVPGKNTQSIGLKSNDSSIPALANLISTKQFPPFEFSGAESRSVSIGNVNDSESGKNGEREAILIQSPILLSADEKILELSGIIEKQKLEHTKISKEMEDVKAEKVSIEFLLRERLEKLVQVELEAREKHMVDQSPTSTGHSPARLNFAFKDQINQMGNRIDVLMRENRDLRAAMKHNKENSANTQFHKCNHETEATELNVKHAEATRRCETLLKERKAVQTIMEMKIMALVTAVAAATDATVSKAGGAAIIGEPAVWLNREVNALQRLVNAAIVALRNADSEYEKQSGIADTTAISSKPTHPNQQSQSIECEKLNSIQTIPHNTQVSSGDLCNNSTIHNPSVSPSVTAPSSKNLLEAPSPVSVEKLIQQRRLELQRARESHRKHNI